MNRVISMFRGRRNDRLSKRGIRMDDETNVNWITTENNSHIPLQNGVSVGGWSKGKTFNRAKSVEKQPVSTVRSPSQKLATEMGKARSVESTSEKANVMEKALKHAEVGAKMYVVKGGNIVGFKKVTEPTDGGEEGDTWERILGESDTGRGVLHESKLGTNSARLAALSSNNQFFSDRKKATAYVNKMFPFHHPEYGKRGAFHEGDDGRDIVTYTKNVSGTNELYEAAKRRDIYPEFRFNKFLKDENESKPDSTRIEYGDDGKSATAIAVYKVSQGLGKKKLTKEVRYKMKLKGTKETVIDSDGKIRKTSSGTDDVYFNFEAEFTKED